MPWRFCSSGPRSPKPTFCATARSAGGGALIAQPASPSSSTPGARAPPQTRASSAVPSATPAKADSAESLSRST